MLLGWNSYLPPAEAFPNGKAAAQTALQLDPDLAEAHTSLAALAHTLGTTGKPVEAVQIFDDLTRQAKQKYVAPYFFAGIHVGLGENDRALEYLEKAYEEHSNWLIYLHIDPSMDDLRDDPRFQDLLRRVGLPALTTAPPSEGSQGGVREAVA